MQELSTGSRINNAKDDAAGQICNTINCGDQGLEIASRNVADGQSLVDTAEGALQETHTSFENERDWCASCKWYVINIG